MIVDTSALIAILANEEGADALSEAVESGGGFLPSPAQVEFTRVAAGVRFGRSAEAAELLVWLQRFGIVTLPFTAEQARVASEANARYGKGMGGPLNLLDLMVYAVAKDRGAPILFTGRDFSATDALVHPASRLS